MAQETTSTRVRVDGLPTTSAPREGTPEREHLPGRKQTTAMGGGGAHGGTTYKGYTIPHNKRWHTVAGKGLCAVMWAKQDGAVLLGLRHPWDGHDDHSHGHGHEHEGSSSSSH
ncbi:hypothetical protein EJB05_40921 [Eragrostis curvula]|uniref:Uncharacterized protein n=1 Tax=Eragrostis curvula TaxID=38414 RepID=A0A5J9T804_9POAL|nr:hypothetical protein EJB05_40921 [Eragrostis curvula]